MLDPFVIEAGIQDMTSWLPVSTDVWGACQFRVVTTCVTVGGVHRGVGFPRSPSYSVSIQLSQYRNIHDLGHMRDGYKELNRRSWSYWWKNAATPYSPWN